MAYLSCGHLHPVGQLQDEVGADDSQLGANERAVTQLLHLTVKKGNLLLDQSFLLVDGRRELEQWIRGDEL